MRKSGMYSARRFRKTMALGAAIFLLSAESPVFAEGLVAHHATYILSLAPDNKNSQITGAEGVMVYDLKNACDGWATDLKLKFVMSLDNGENRDFETSQVTWESKDGSAYRYTIKNGYGGQTDQLRGEARIDAAAGGKGTATADLPTRSEAKLPDDTLFPITHTRLLLQKAAEGESSVTAEYFDGTASTEAMQASALIGAGEKGWGGDFSKKFPDLADKTSYPIGLAFYLGDKSDAVPDSEQFLRLYEDGVMGAISFSLGSIKIRAVLDTLELKPDGGC